MGGLWWGVGTLLGHEATLFVSCAWLFMLALVWVGVGAGLLFENCIVDASIFVL